MIAIFLGIIALILAIIGMIGLVFGGALTWEKNRGRALAYYAAAILLTAATFTVAMSLTDDDTGPCVSWETIVSNNVPYRYCVKHAEPIPAGEQP